MGKQEKQCKYYVLVFNKNSISENPYSIEICTTAEEATELIAKLILKEDCPLPVEVIIAQSIMNAEVDYKFLKHAQNDNF